ncbi:MAG: hypothetical protein PHO62_07890 [Sulfurimonas sp.]|uniref:hypothetical protein n=1 Tax=Sulfurimonas sp. TaxID=2022749 RepID=UPI0026291DF5|nr:hypothetical protein [Sulfurimonas sp.]MDD5373328.1 hypothetical protein [Sulfurimonas sp.]
MKFFSISIDEFTIGEVVSLEKYDLFKSGHSMGFIKNFKNGRFLKFDNSKDAFIANVVAKNYADIYRDGALLIFCEIKSGGGASLCFMDTAALSENDGIVKLENLNAQKFASDKNKIEDMLLFFKTTSYRPIRYFISGGVNGCADAIAAIGEEMDEKMIRAFMPKPFLSASSKNKMVLKMAGAFLVPLLLSFVVGSLYEGSATGRISTVAKKLTNERTAMASEVEALRANPLIVNEKSIGTISHKRIAI